MSNVIEKAILGNMGGAYVTYVASVDEGQWHVGTLGWIFNRITGDLVDVNRLSESDVFGLAMRFISWDGVK